MIPRWSWSTWSLAALTLMLLLYCLISAVNARATYESLTSNLEYHDCIGWLPHSFDANATWSAFWTYLGLACAFWSIRDWLLAKTAHEQLATYHAVAPIDGALPQQRIPAHVKKLLTLLTLNGGLLAVEAIIQRLADSPKLLFIVSPEIHQTAITQFGPYAYRANAAQYLNLLWPVCLGFWWTTRHEAGPKRRHLFLGCVGMMAAASMMSASKGGALVCAAMLFVVLLLAAARSRHPNRASGQNTLKPLFLLVLAFMGVSLGWKQSLPLMASLDASMERRQRIYAAARQMAGDLGVFGSGPGTYESVSELYRPASTGFWPAQVHNDWLEVRITFGLPGAALILAALAVVLCRWFIAGGLPVGSGVVVPSWLALAGGLTHAFFDFPFQIHSIVFLLAVLCALLFTASSKPWKS